MTEYEELPVRLKEALLKKTKANSPFWQLLDMDLIDVKNMLENVLCNDQVKRGVVKSLILQVLAQVPV